jgi:gamma-glutamyltranspeptidase/glutathione hydrolase
MVASNEILASRAGVEILRQGGNAVDAAVAVGFALAVTLPEAGNLGGGGYMLIRLADGRTAALDYRETAPLAATRNMYLDRDGNLTKLSTEGHLASGVPGSVAGMTEALRRYGTLPLATVMAPAIRLASGGRTVDAAFSTSVTDKKSLLERFAADSLFMPNGNVPRPGTLFAQPDLARTLTLIAREGPSAFYRGRIAEQIVAEMRQGGGIITREDLASYKPVWRTPISTTYKGYTLLTMPPSSSGGITVTESLNILEAFGADSHFGSADRVHALAAAYQRAFLDRNSKLGDPAFVEVPLETLTSKSYAARLARTIQRDRATPTSRLAESLREGTETTHYSVVDRFGNAVATTTTLNTSFGSGVFVKGAGFFLNNEMDDFSAAPGKPNYFGLVQGEANAIQPGKRMLSAMSPTIVLDPAGKLLLVTGARGGPRIITNTSQVILNVIDHRMSLADAMNAPRVHYQSLPDSLRLERGGFTEAAISALGRIGYNVYFTASSGASVTTIMRTKSGYEGMDDPRSSGGAAGY